MSRAVLLSVSQSSPALSFPCLEPVKSPFKKKKKRRAEGEEIEQV
jgi:hypothetical protein